MAQPAAKSEARILWQMGRRQHWVFRGAIVLSCCLAGMISATIWTPQAHTPQALLLVSLPIFGLYWLKWRCLRCQARLRVPILPHYCPQCGGLLKKETP